MSERVVIEGLQIAQPLHDLVRDQAAPGTGIEPEAFWRALAEILRDLAPRNRELLDKRDAMQARIDAWHVERRGQAHDAAAYKAFLEEIGYLVPEGEAFGIECRQCALGQPLRRPLRHRRDR
jgi:malate synthase